VSASQRRSSATRSHIGQTAFFGRLFRSSTFFSRASRLSSSSFDTLNTWRIALSNLSNSVFPGTFGAGSGFTRRLYRRKQWPSGDLLGHRQTGYNRAASENTASVIRLTTAPQWAFVLSPETTVNLCGGSGYIPPHEAGILFLETPDPTIMRSEGGRHHVGWRHLATSLRQLANNHLSVQ